MSVNAVLRAKRLGYTQVGWYRGGMHSWMAAKLPVATPVVKATLLP
ncbi:MAG: rhodanese-like domain-containing protein [Burkholderiales bacterium]